MKTCCICLSDDNYLIHPKNCECKVFLHNICLNICEKYGLLCPICRIKTNEEVEEEVEEEEVVEEVEEEVVEEEVEDIIIHFSYDPRLLALTVGISVVSFIGYLYYISY